MRLWNITIKVSGPDRSLERSYRGTASTAEVAGRQAKRAANKDPWWDESWYGFGRRKKVVAAVEDLGEKDFG